MNRPPDRGAGPWQRLHAAVCRVAGWRRRMLAVALGALAVAALPPVSAPPVLLVSFSGLVWLIESAPDKRSAFGAGWWFGLGYFMAGLYWIAFAFLVDAARFAWMIPFALVGLAAGLALYTGAATLLARLVAPAGPGRVLALAASWTAMEWVRGAAFTGFPWNLLGMTWTASDAVMQFASVTGVYGLTWLTVAAAAAPALLADRDGPQRWVQPAAAAAMLLAVWAGGSLRLGGARDAVVPGVMLRIVQPNISQPLKWRPELRDRHFARQLSLSRAAGTPTHVIWPETAVQFILADDAARRRILATAVPPGGLLMSGAIRVRQRPGGAPEIWNSLQAIDRAGRIVATYDKFHLVPFGEYVPLRSVIDIPKFTAGRLDFSAGPGPRTLVLPGLPPASPLICYEAIFPGAVTDPENRPGWLLNVTNDGWFGISAGPYQHFAAARLRAVEEGLPLVRAANTGISAVVDSYGRITARLGLGVAGTLDAGLPEALATPPPYVRFRDAIVLVLVILSAAAGWILRRRPA